MSNSADILNSLVSITQFNRGQASRIFDRLRKESRLVVLKNNQPEAIILSPEEFSRLSDMEEDYILLLEATKRLENASDKSTSMDEFIKELGISEEELASVGDVVIE